MINLSNYEEYFLLYIDNELSKEQCEAVEAFARQHPHLAAELNMLKDAKLPPEDAVVFSDKSSLYKAADNTININNYEEYFLLHTDKELSATQEEEVEQFVLQHPQLQEEFLLLQKTKLIPETVECPDKHRLYSRHSKRVIPLYITRVAVAAAITSVVVLIGSFLINTNNHHPQVAINTPQKEHVEKTSTPEKQMNVVSPAKKQNEVVVAKNEAKETKKAPVNKAIRAINKKPALPDNKEGNNEPVTAQIDPLPATQQVIHAPEDIVTSNNAAPEHKQPTALKPLEEVKENGSASTVVYVSNDYTTAKPAVYKELNTDEDDQTLYVGSLQLNKAKVNGLFKKAAHLLSGKNKESNL